MHISELNKQFDALEGLSDEQKDLLIEEGLVFGTRAKLTFKEAARHCWKDKNYVPAPGVYSGYIIVSNPRNWEEAERWAKVRVWVKPWMASSPQDALSKSLNQSLHTHFNHDERTHLRPESRWHPV